MVWMKLRHRPTEARGIVWNGTAQQIRAHLTPEQRHKFFPFGIAPIKGGSVTHIKVRTRHGMSDIAEGDTLILHWVDGEEELYANKPDVFSTRWDVVGEVEP